MTIFLTQKTTVRLKNRSSFTVFSFPDMKKIVQKVWLVKRYENLHLINSKVGILEHLG